MAATEGWFLAGDPHKNEFNHGLKTLVQDMIQVFRMELKQPIRLGERMKS